MRLLADIGGTYVRFATLHDDGRIDAVETWLTALPWARGQIGIGSQGNLLFNQPFPFLGLGVR